VVLARTRYVGEVDALSERGATTVVAEEFESTLAILSGALQTFDVAIGNLARFVAELRHEGYEHLRAPAGLALDPWLAELLEQVSAEWVDVAPGFPGEASLRELDLRARSGATVLAVERGSVVEPHPSPEFRLLPEDRVLAFGSAAAVGRLRELLAVRGDRDPVRG
jgi:CPA2 family monovalent cation:H+ antiporter-2